MDLGEDLLRQSNTNGTQIGDLHSIGIRED
jgi:hypothetical protein